VAAVTEALETLPGVISADVTLTPPEATVVYLPDEVTPEEMIAAIEGAGEYTAEITGGDCQ